MRRQPDRDRSSIDWRIVAAGVLVLLVVVFVFENTTTTRIRFLVPKVSCPLWVALAVPLALGVVIGWLVGHRERD